MKKLKNMLGSLLSGQSKMKKETGSLPQSLPLQEEEATRNPDKPQVYDWKATNKKITEGLHIDCLLLSRNSSSGHHFKCSFLQEEKTSPSSELWLGNSPIWDHLFSLPLCCELWEPSTYLLILRSPGPAQSPWGPPECFVNEWLHI